MVQPVPGFMKLSFSARVRIGIAWDRGNSSTIFTGNRTGKIPSLQIFAVSQWAGPVTSMTPTKVDTLLI